MEIKLKLNPKIRVSYDEMEAYLELPAPMSPDEDYTFDGVMEKVRAAGVRIGVNETKISAMVNERYFDRECLIAKKLKF